MKQDTQPGERDTTLENTGTIYMSEFAKVQLPAVFFFFYTCYLPVTDRLCFFFSHLFSFQFGFVKSHPLTLSVTQLLLTGEGEGYVAYAAPQGSVTHTQHTQRNRLSALFHIHELTDACNWLVSL